MSGPTSEIVKEAVVLQRIPTIYSNDLAGLSAQDRKQIGLQIESKMRSVPDHRYPADYYFSIGKNGDIVLETNTEPKIDDTMVAFPRDGLVACLKQIISELQGHLSLAQFPSRQLAGSFIGAESLATDIAQALKIERNSREEDLVNRDFSQITVPRNMQGVLHLSFFDHHAAIYGDGSDVKLEIKLSRGAKLVIYDERCASKRLIPTFEGVYTSFDSDCFRVFLSEQAVSKREKITACPAQLKAFHAKGDLL